MENHWQEDTEEKHVPPLKPWGAWATSGLGLLIFAAFLAVQAVVVVGAGLVTLWFNPGADDASVTHQLVGDGDILALATIATALVGVTLIHLLINAYRHPLRTTYLGLTPVPVKTLLVWLVMGLLFALLCDRLSQWAGRPTVPDFMIRTYTSANLKPLLWVALIVAAPIFEEIFFRGFLYTGFAASRIGSYGAITLIALIWAIIHPQYDPFDMGIIFLIGLLFGLARLRSGSLYPPLAMHAGINFMAVFQAMTAVGDRG